MAFGNIVETRTYLTFTLDQEDFAVDVGGVREVLDFTDVTRVPRTPSFMKGVINLRGSVVPVVDMRLKFGLPEAEKTVDTCVIVLEVELDGEITVIGAIADSVKEVFELESGDIEPPPRLGTRMETDFISGMGKHNDDFIIILDVNRVFSTQELEFFRQSEDGLSPSLTVPDVFEEEHEDKVDDPAGDDSIPADEKPGEAEREPEETDKVKSSSGRKTQAGSKTRKSASGASGKSGKIAAKPAIKKK